ncbi:MAG TPA: hypothetical protein VHN99_11095 [Deinococcales bacterium]|nr:hypothetical protein [Deinococcales bacterium]
MQDPSGLPLVVVSDEAFDEALARFAVVDDQIVPRGSLGRPVERDEELSRYAFTGYVEALRSDEFDESALDTVQDLELEGRFETEDDAWEAVKRFYATRDLALLRVGEGEWFVVGPELLERLGLA